MRNYKTGQEYRLKTDPNLFRIVENAAEGGLDDVLNLYPVDTSLEYMDSDLDESVLLASPEPVGQADDSWNVPPPDDQQK